MDLSFDNQSQVLEHLDEARKILRNSRHDRVNSADKKDDIAVGIDVTFQQVQLLDNQPC